MLEKSRALDVNLQETAVDRDSIRIDPRYNVLRDAVSDYQGILAAADHLLIELHHPFCNWDVLTGELRSFVLKNLAVYSRSPQAVEAISLMVEIILDVVSRAPRQRQKLHAADALMAYLEKILQRVDDALLLKLLPSFDRAFLYLSTLDRDMLKAFVTSFHPLARVAKLMLDRIEKSGMTPDYKGVVASAARLLIILRRITYLHWLEVEGPLMWLGRVRKQYDVTLSSTDEETIKALFYPVTHPVFKKYLGRLDELDVAVPGTEALRELVSLPGYLDIVRHYREIARELSRMSIAILKTDTAEDVTVGKGQEVGLHLFFLFHMVEMDGLSRIHEDVLRQINRTLISLIRTADVEQLRDVMVRSLDLLKQQVGPFPRTALQCIDALGKEVFARDRTSLIEIFLEKVIDFGFQTPGITGVDQEWHVLCNPYHLQNIRVWLGIVGRKPKVCGTLLSALIINLRLAGTCIKDTDLFQRDMSRLLNSDISPIYNMVKQFAKVLPVYFNEIGAEGLLRDVSTELDEISNRKDLLIHFLRKQSHVESNNLIVDFIEAILCFWYSREKACLAPFLAPEILQRVPVQGEYVDHVHRLVRVMAEELGLEPFAGQLDRLLNLSEEKLEEILDKVFDVPRHEKRRLSLLVKMYRLETLKYKLGTQEIRYHLEEAFKTGFDGLERVLDVIDSQDPEECLPVILDELDNLKDIILSDKTYEVQESIYHKRHIAADIPSMYGRYHEKKFDALGLTFRLENLANVYFERLIAEMEMPFITRAVFVHILKVFKLFWRAVQLNGVYSKKFDIYLTLLEKSLEVKKVSFTQYLDIVKGLSEGVKDMIYVYYLSPHQDNIARIVRQLGREQLLPKYRMTGEEDNVHLISQVTEMFLREMISSTFGLQHLDNFIGRVFQVLREQREHLDTRELDMLLSYDPGQDLCSIYEPDAFTMNLIQLGNKGYNLVLLAKEGLPIPPGIIVTTEVFRYYPLFKKLPGALIDFSRQLKRGIAEIEKRTERRFGDPENPLLMSVRSGAAISMPGMMSTIINVGITPDIAENIADSTGNVWFAWDNYRRFVQSWAMSMGLERDVFTGLMRNHKERCGVREKRDFTGRQMRELALLYRAKVIEMGIEIEDDPFKQLLNSIRLVLGSWDSEKAFAYREIMEISDDWGTAVIVQSMSYGNLSKMAGTGVVFTANPKRKLDKVMLWGDYTTGNQGEDIVSGLVSTHPISIEQSESMGLDPENSMEKRFPDVYGKLFELAKHLIYDKKWTPQEIEFTFEGPEAEQLHILQGRDMTTKKRQEVEVFAPSAGLEASYMSRGIGVSGGAMSGVAAFTLKDIHRLRKREPDKKIILIRADTVPDDIREISLADGILTAKGGQTSHAAIVAFRLDKTCVVGCQQLSVNENSGYALLGDKKIVYGDSLSIDGRNGAVYIGEHETTMEEESYYVI